MDTRRVGAHAFWQRLGRHGERAAVVDDSRHTVVSYHELSGLVARQSAQLQGATRTLAAVEMGADLGALVGYLSALESGHVVWPYTPDAPADAHRELLRSYEPGIVMARHAGYQIVTIAGPAAPLHSDLAMILATSGSTGSSKFVRLSHGNLSASAEQTARVLGLQPNDRIVTSLPLHHIYGLSVLHGALAVGATLVLSSHSVLDRRSWDLIERERVTLLPAVPTQLRMMQESHFERRVPSHLRLITISGSSMGAATQRWLTEELIPRRVSICSMYGMTEACGRIAALPPDQFAAHPASVGRAVSGGALAVAPSGEIVYRGPNVMLGYARARGDLERGDELVGRLATGDCGSLDAHGNLYVLGRLSRWCKVCDQRVDLDDLEKGLAGAGYGAVAMISDDRRIFMFHTELAQGERLAGTLDLLAQSLHLPRGVFVSIHVQEIPRTASGKTSYGALRARPGT